MDIRLKQGTIVMIAAAEPDLEAWTAWAPSHADRVFALRIQDEMYEACRAKFLQYGPAQEALPATGTRPLAHRVRRDSQTIPGIVMADIWMRIPDSLAMRRRTRRKAASSSHQEPAG